MLQDYHRETMALVPRSQDWEAFLETDRLFFASEGGDVSVGGWLPDLYRKAGLDLESIAALCGKAAVRTRRSPASRAPLARSREAAHVDPRTKAQAPRAT
jgi:hypothetical protein